MPVWAKLPVTQAFGLGLSGPCPTVELERLEEFFRSHGAAVAIEVAEPADRGLTRALLARGYVAEDQSDVLVHRLGRSEDAPSASPISVRRAGAAEVPEVVELVLAGFFEGKPIPPEFSGVMEAMFRTANSTVFVAEHEGTMAGAALLTVQRRIAILSGATTLPAFRGRGIQAALLRARVAAAGALRAEAGMVATLQGTTSHRNAERTGFEKVYGRTKYIKASTA